jgi:putative pyruvate formate lyase activating enzyme
VLCHPDLGRTLLPAEYNRIADEMIKLGMVNGWIQEFGSADHYRPDFEREEPFQQ